MIRFRKRLDADLGAEGWRSALTDPEELGAALQWMVDGALDFRAHGEAPHPPSMDRERGGWWEALHVVDPD